MRFYKLIDNEYISSIGTGGGGTEIAESEYYKILSTIQNKPPREGSIDYRLKEDLTWEQYEREPEPPAEEMEIDSEEALNLLLGGVMP